MCEHGASMFSAGSPLVVIALWIFWCKVEYLPFKPWSISFFSIIQPLIFMKMKGLCPLSVLDALDQCHPKLLKRRKEKQMKMQAEHCWSSFSENRAKTYFVQTFLFQIEKKRSWIEFFHPCQGVQSVLSLAGASVYLSLRSPQQCAF